MHSFKSILARLKRSILIISDKITDASKKDTRKSKKNIQPPSWESSI